MLDLFNTSPGPLLTLNRLGYSGMDGAQAVRITFAYSGGINRLRAIGPTPNRKIKILDPSMPRTALSRLVQGGTFLTKAQLGGFEGFKWPPFTSIPVPPIPLGPSGDTRTDMSVYDLLVPIPRPTLEPSPKPKTLNLPLEPPQPGAPHAP